MTASFRLLTAALVCLMQSVLAAAAEPPAELARWLGPQQWEKDTDGPVLALGEEGSFDDTHIFAPAVSLENGKYQLWYCGSRGTRYTRVFRLGLATGADGRHFEKYANNPVLAFADGQRSVLTPGLLRHADGSVLRENGKLRMWFSATAFGQTELHSLHESTSTDGQNWSAPSPPELEHVYCPSVLKSDAGYQLWYVDVETRPWKVRYATSGDGRAWQVRPRPVLDFTQTWESGILVYPCVLKADGVYLMWYGSYQAEVKQTTAIGFAASLDGVNWHKHPQNPVLRPSPDRPWESNYVTSGCVLRQSDGSFRYWYASRKAPPFTNLYFAINTARWSGPQAQQASRPVPAGGAPGAQGLSIAPASESRPQLSGALAPPAFQPIDTRNADPRPSFNQNGAFFLRLVPQLLASPWGGIDLTRSFEHIPWPSTSGKS